MKKKLKNKPPANTFIFEELEARQLFSGGIEGLIDTDLTSNVVDKSRYSAKFLTSADNLEIGPRYCR